MWSQKKVDPLMGPLDQKIDDLIKKSKEDKSKQEKRMEDLADISESARAEIQRLNQIDGLKGLTSRFKTRYRYSKFFAPKVWVLWCDRNFSVFHVREMDWVSDGIVGDSWWGRAADVVGSNCQPVQIVVKGKASTGFIIDGDKGCGINVRRDDDDTLAVKDPLTGRIYHHALAYLRTTSEFCWSVVDTKKISEAVGADATLRTKIIFLLIGVVAGFILGGAVTG